MYGRHVRWFWGLWSFSTWTLYGAPRLSLPLAGLAGAAHYIANGPDRPVRSHPNRRHAPPQVETAYATLRF